MSPTVDNMYRLFLPLHPFLAAWRSNDLFLNSHVCLPPEATVSFLWFQWPSFSLSFVPLILWCFPHSVWVSKGCLWWPLEWCIFLLDDFQALFCLKWSPKQNQEIPRPQEKQGHQFLIDIEAISIQSHVCGCLRAIEGSPWQVPSLNLSHKVLIFETWLRALDSEIKFLRFEWRRHYFSAGWFIEDGKCLHLLLFTIGISPMASSCRKVENLFYKEGI